MPQITGVVKFDDKPKQGINIKADTDNKDLGENTTTYDGLFSFTVTEGAVVHLTFPKQPDGFTIQGPNEIYCQVGADTVLDPVVYVPGPGSVRISGSVELVKVDRDGNELQGPYETIPVEVLDENQQILGQTLTDAQGHFLIPIRTTAKRVTLKFEKYRDGYVLDGPDIIGLALRQGTASELPTRTYRLALGAIHGIINTRDGKGLVGAEIEVFDPSTNRPLIDQKTRKVAAQKTTTVDGSYQFNYLLPGLAQVRFANRFVDDTENVWELTPGCDKQTWQILPGQVVTAKPVVYQPEQHIIERMVKTTDGQPATGRLVEVRTPDGKKLLQAQRTGADGKVTFTLEQGGDYEVAVYATDRFQYPGDALLEEVSVHSTSSRITVIAEPPQDGGGAARVGSPADATDPLNDLAAYPILTEEIGYPPSPIAPSAGIPTMAPQGSLGGLVESTLRQLLGWKPKTDDAKGFVGALNASFTCAMVEGRSECTWVPRTYAVQTDLSGGITGAQASIYSRIKDAADKSLPLLDGLYPLDEEAKAQDIQALKSVIQTQLTALVAELGIPGGPRVQRVNQLFGLLLGTATFWTNPPPKPPQSVPQTDPDKLDASGTLGNLRDEMGLSLLPNQTLVNTVEDEQNVSNFRIICDYITSLAQSWLNNYSFFVLNSGAQPFFGTLLVLLSRQLSVIAEKVNEVRFTLDSVFIGPSERQSLRLNFPVDASNNPVPPMFLEDLLFWIENFATQEGPQLITEGGRYAVGTSFGTTAGSLLATVQQIPAGPNAATPLPDGFFTPRVQRSLQDLADQLFQLVSLASTTSYKILPEPQAHAQEVKQLLNLEQQQNATRRVGVSVPQRRRRRL